MSDKVCKRCGESFTGSKGAYLCTNCKKKARARAMKQFFAKNPEYAKNWRDANKDRLYSYTMKRLYNINASIYKELAKAQNDSCAICGRKADTWKGNGGRLVIDHDHTTGEVRGLLCPYCNRALGQFFDSPAILQSAIDYISRRERSPA